MDCPFVVLDFVVCGCWCSYYFYAGKELTVVFPPLEKYDKAKSLSIKVNNNEEWKEFIRNEHGRVEEDGRIVNN